MVRKRRATTDPTGTPSRLHKDKIGKGSKGGAGGRLTSRRASRDARDTPPAGSSAAGGRRPPRSQGPAPTQQPPHDPGEGVPAAGTSVKRKRRPELAGVSATGINWQPEAIGEGGVFLAYLHHAGLTRKRCATRLHKRPSVLVVFSPVKGSSNKLQTIA
jgi:hypothetical protein